MEDTPLVAVSVSTESAFTPAQPTGLFQSQQPIYAAGLHRYDVSADGQRFLIVAPVLGIEAAPPKIRVVLNWFERFLDRWKSVSEFPKRESN